MLFQRFENAIDLCPLQNLYVVVLMSNVMVFGDGTLDEVMRVGIPPRD